MCVNMKWMTNCEISRTSARNLSNWRMCKVSVQNKVIKRKLLPITLITGNPCHNLQPRLPSLLHYYDRQCIGGISSGKLIFVCGVGSVRVLQSVWLWGVGSVVDVFEARLWFRGHWRGFSCEQGNSKHRNMSLLPTKHDGWGGTPPDLAG